MGRQPAYPKKGTKTCAHCGRSCEVLLLKSGQRNTQHFCDSHCRSAAKMAKDAAKALTGGKIHKPPKPRDGTCGVVSLEKAITRARAEVDKIRAETNRINGQYWEMLRHQRSRR